MTVLTCDVPLTGEDVGRHDQQFWLGVDGGGTNTRAVIVDENGHKRGQGYAEAANYHRVGLESAVSAIVKAVHEACHRAGITPQQITAACFGLAGVSHPDHHRTMLDALKAALPISEILLETDARIALAGATDNRPGVVIIAGTGSIACGINSQGEFARAGGWGPVMGDEGSGTYIGKRALEVVMEAYDGRGRRTRLTDAVLKHFRIKSPAELPGVIYNTNIQAMREVAQLSRVVVQAAEAGSRMAQEILREAADELARAAVAVITQLRMQSDSFRVACVGGVFESGEWVVAPLRQAIAEIAPLAVVTPPLYPPVIGAVKIAMNAFAAQEVQVG
ncbi:MAG TPA: BadF/BadG/BcrA/BcrD ATPase family protein [Blastocatellia bacterium]|nr:BadF/BadG/BcrA/BcrD ATPase family protein [Blastocatellia bacterium]